MDWNSFFSAVAQSAAAIVAIFGGFIITKIISNQTEFQRKQGEISECIRTCVRLVNHGETVGFPFIEGISRKGGLHSIETRIYNDTPIQDAEHYYRTTDFSPYVDRKELLKSIAELIDNFHKNPSEPLTRAGVIRGDAAANKFHTEKRNAEDSVNRFIVEANSQSLLARRLATEIVNNPYSSSLVVITTICIIILFFGGVIYPLSFMPMSINQEPMLSISAFWDILFSLRGALMAGISIIFTSIMLIFMIINLRMKYDPRDITKLQYYSNPDVFSSYLRHARDNEAFRNSNA